MNRLIRRLPLSMPPSPKRSNLMKDKLTASVISEGSAHYASLCASGKRFDVQPTCFDDDFGGARELAQKMVAKLTKAIAQHDKAVNAKLIARCKRLALALRDLHDEQNGPPTFSRTEQWEASMAEAVAVLAVEEKS